MKPFQKVDLDYIIANKWTEVKQKIDALSNEVIMANSTDILANNIYEEFFIEPVTIYEEDLSKRQIKQGKLRNGINDVFFNNYNNNYVEVDGIIATFVFPFIGDAFLFNCKANTFSLSGYPDIDLGSTSFSITINRSLNDMKTDGAKDKLLEEVSQKVTEIKKGISYANNDINVFNSNLKKESQKLIVEKRKKVESFFSIASMLEIPIEKKEYAKTHIPLKRNIVPITTNYKSENAYCISDKDYLDILATIKHTGSTCERTPSSYKSLKEEDLRNVFLAALNATYSGLATGEAFRNKGKTDICIEMENRAAFVAECKMWTGQKEISSAINQLDGYLTWRDCKTALLFFVRRKDFLRTLDSVKKTLDEMGNIKSVKNEDKNEFKCLLQSSSNPGQEIQVRIMLFNFFCE